MRRKKRADYKFTKKKHSGAGAVAFAFSFVPLALFIYAVTLSYQSGGNAQEKVGCIGVAAILAALLTLRVSIHEARKENVIKNAPVAGAVMSVLMLTGWIAVYVLGWIAA